MSKKNESKYITARFQHMNVFRQDLKVQFFALLLLLLSLFFKTRWAFDDVIHFYAEIYVYTQARRAIKVDKHEPEFFVVASLSLLILNTIDTRLN